MATYNSDGTIANIQSLINGAATGDTVTIPNGSYSWAGNIQLNKAITLRALNITPNNPPNPTVVVTHAAGAGTLITITAIPAGDTVLAGISFQPGTATGSYIDTGSTGTNPGIIIMHNCLFELPNFQLVEGVRWTLLGGLIYQCAFQCTSDGGPQGWGSGSGCLQYRGLYPWYNVSTFGALDTTGRINLYVEDCTFYNMYNQALDIDDMGRLNVRHCNIINSQAVTHGITSMWGGRQLDMNNNVFEYRPLSPNSSGIRTVNVNRWMWMRGGTGRFWNNQVDAIISGDWGNKPSWMFIDEPLTRPGSGNGGQCETKSMYPGTRWAGTGGDGTARNSGVIISPSPVDPVYIWNNSPGPHSNGSTNWNTNDQSGYGCDANGPTSAVFLLNRDIFLSAPNNNPSPPYTEYVYPHPLRVGGGGGGGGGPQQGTASNSMGRLVTSTPRVLRTAVAKLK